MSLNEFRQGMLEIGWEVTATDSADGQPIAYAGALGAEILIRGMTVLCILPRGPAKNGIIRSLSEGLEWAKECTTS